MDGKIFEVAKGLLGENVPPLHPNCRSTIVPYFKDYEPEMRLYRDPKTGKNEYTYNVSYKDWRKDYEDALSPTGRRTVWELIGKTRNSAENIIRKNKKYETLLILDEKDNVVHAEKGSQIACICRTRPIGFFFAIITPQATTTHHAHHSRLTI